MPMFPKPPRQKRNPCFLEWLIDVLNRQRSPKNAYWLDEKAKIFAVRWVHQKSPLYTEECSNLFKLWRTEGSRIWRNRNDDAEKHLKTNFRMNLRSPNFVELTNIYENKNLDEFPAKVFKVNKTTNKVGKMVRQRDETFMEPSCTQNGHATYNKFSTHIKQTPAPNFKPQSYEKSSYEESTPEFYPWLNKPTGTMPRMSDSQSSELWNRTSPHKLSNWNMSRGDSNLSLPDSFNEFSFSNSLVGHNPFNHDYIISAAEGINTESLLLPSTEETSINNFLPCQDMDKNFHNLLDLETSRFPGCIPKLQLHHSLVTSPTDSGFMERQSFSSIWSCENTPGQNFDDLDFTWPLDDFSDSVFE